MAQIRKIQCIGAEGRLLLRNLTELDDRKEKTRLDPVVTFADSLAASHPRCEVAATKQEPKIQLQLLESGDIGQSEHWTTRSAKRS